MERRQLPYPQYSHYLVDRSGVVYCLEGPVARVVPPGVDGRILLRSMPPTRVCMSITREELIAACWPEEPVAAEVVQPPEKPDQEAPRGKDSGKKTRKARGKSPNKQSDS